MAAISHMTQEDMQTTATAQTKADRHRIDDVLAKSPVVGSEPRKGLYKYVHPHRLRLNGVFMETKVWLKSKTRNDQPVPFLIYSRPRSGTTLLVNVLNQAPHVRCDNELLHDLILRPVGFLRDLPKRAGPDIKAYGVKLLSYQLMEVQRVTRPIAFFDQLTRMNYKVIHLTRRTWDQTLSLVKAQHSGVYFGETHGAEGFSINPETFLLSLRWNMRMLDYENEVMRHVDHIAIDYERDLKTPAARHTSVGELCRELGLEVQSSYETTLKPTGGKFGAQKIANMDEIVDRVRSEGLAHLLPDHLA